MSIHFCELSCGHVFEDLMLMWRRFYRVGGDSRVAGFLLAGATTVLLFIGTGPIAYIRELQDVFVCRILA
jgi:hypothetical protein